MERMAAEERNVEGLRDVFKCFICMERLQDARLCPHCSKLCCYPCIRRWVLEQRPQCPHCRCGLRLTDLVKCRWAEEVNQKLDSLVSPSPAQTQEPQDRDLCNVHQEKLTVYCTTCQSCICHHCALWGETHSKHSLKPLDEEYGVRVTQVSEEVRKLRRRLCTLIGSLQELERNMETIRNAKEERVREMRCTVELMVARLDAQLKNKLVSLTGQKRSLSMEVEMMEGVLSEVEHQLASASRSALVRNSSDLFRMLRQIQKGIPQPALSVSADFPSELVPPYEGELFELCPFSALRAKAEPVYSRCLRTNGLSWRLKVYPDGNGVVRGNYLSVFLELTEGGLEQAKYEYRVEMMHHATGGDPAHNIIREFASEFEVGECWGYNRFFKLDQLGADGFLDFERDAIRLQFHVRPPTYYQKYKDLFWHYSNLEIMHAETLLELDATKERLAVEMSHNQVEPPSVESARTDGEEPNHPVNGDISEGDLPQPSVLIQEVSDAEEGEIDEPQSTERDVDDAGRTRVTDNDVEEEALASGLEQPTHRPRILRALGQSSPTIRRNVPLHRISAFLTELNLELSDEEPTEPHVVCPACSPRSKQVLFRRLRSRHGNVFSTHNSDIPWLRQDSRSTTGSSSLSRSSSLDVLCGDDDGLPDSSTPVP